MLHIILSHKTPTIWRTGSFGLYWMVYSIWPFGPSSISTAPLFPLKPEKMVVPTGVSWKKRKKDNTILCLLKKTLNCQSVHLSLHCDLVRFWLFLVLAFHHILLVSWCYQEAGLPCGDSVSPAVLHSILLPRQKPDGQGWEKKKKRKHLFVLGLLPGAESLSEVNRGSKMRGNSYELCSEVKGITWGTGY